MKSRIHTMPKLECPFVREKNDAGHYVVIDEIAPGMEWVFEDDTARAVEKLDGENASIHIENGIITGVWSRTMRVPFFTHAHAEIIDAVRNAYGRKYMEFMADGQHFGECIGPKIQKNIYGLDKVLWVPLTMLYDKYYYRSWGEYPKTFDSMSEWFKDLPSAYAMSRGNYKVDAEGVVFTHLDGRMAKLRRDMFEGYTGRRH